MIKINKNKKIILVFIWAFIILILLGTPMEEYKGDVFTYSDKFAHAFVFGVLAFLINFALETQEKISRHMSRYMSRRNIFLSGFISLTYASFCEIVQMIVPGRTESMLDITAGGIGIILFLIIYHAIFRRKKT